MRLAHNRLVHEYVERPDAMLPALKRAREFIDTRCAAHHAIRAYAQARFAV
jgi:4'-phosphopantetheinyl transferase EntD